MRALGTGGPVKELLDSIVGIQGVLGFDHESLVAVIALGFPWGSRSRVWREGGALSGAMGWCGAWADVWPWVVSSMRVMVTCCLASCETLTRPIRLVRASVAGG